MSAARKAAARFPSHHRRYIIQGYVLLCVRCGTQFTGALMGHDYYCEDCVEAIYHQMERERVDVAGNQEQAA